MSASASSSFVATVESGASVPVTSKASRESGYAYLMALFMVLIVIVSSGAAVENVLATGRRQREDEVIWRGNEYVRAIRLYYKKTGHYPQTLAELQKGQPQLHFLRYAAYKDPVNKDDGAWRLIYVNAAGQIIGSVRYATLQQMALLDLNGGQACSQPGAQQGSQPGLGTPASSLASSSAGGTNTNCQPGQSSTATSTSAQSQQNSSTTQPNSSTAQSGQNPSAGMQTTQMGANGQPLTNPLLALKPTGPVTGPVLGGFITGVGSTVDKKTLKIYKGGKKYNEWEFIWNPLEDQAAAMQQGLNPGQAGLPGQPGQGIGGAAGSIFGNIGGNGAAGTAGAGGTGTAPTTNPIPGQNSTPPQSSPQQ
jgi:hypothetical protein